MMVFTAHRFDDYDELAREQAANLVRIREEGLSATPLKLAHADDMLDTRPGH